MLRVVPRVGTDVRHEIRVTPRVRFNLYVLHATRAEVMTLVADALAGTAPLQPLVLRDVASELGCHESTVSRAVAEKYVQTAQGVLPLKAFLRAA